MRPGGFAVAVTVALGLACAGSEPGPYEGDGVLLILVTSTESTAAVDGPVLMTRFEAVGLGAEMKVQGPDQLAFRLTGVGEGVDIGPLLEPGVVTITFPDGAQLTNADIVDAKADHQEWGPFVDVTLSDAGGERFCTLSGANVGEPIPMAVDGIEQSSPIIREPICGGQLQISMGHADADFADAVALAVALRTDPLQSKWTLDSVSTDPVMPL